LFAAAVFAAVLVLLAVDFGNLPIHWLFDRPVHRRAVIAYPTVCPSGKRGRLSANVTEFGSVEAKRCA
jgi:hypothetical protein